VAWYKEWFGEDYLELYAHRDVGEAERHTDFVERTLTAGEGSRPGAVLDLACGAGRHTLALRKRGYRALGLDLSLTLLTQPPPFPRVAGDIRHLPFADGSFDWVLNFFTSFGYFADERENFEVLEEIRRVLAPGGRFLIDLFNRERVLEGLVPSETKEMDGGVAEIERWFDDSTQRINKRIRISTADGRSRSFVESVRAYSEPEVTIGLQWAGLEADQLFGDFDGRPFDSSSDRLILVGHRPRPEERAS
jgi:SAM-dependent methyltransferase